MKSLVLSIFVACSILFSLQINANAVSENLPFNQTVLGTVTDGENQRYVVSAQENGQLTVAITSSQDLKVLVFDKDGTPIYSYNRLAQDGTGTQTFKQTTYVDEGKYYIDVYQINTKEATFKISSTFKAINSAESEPNDKQEQAQILSSDKKLTGMMTYRDTEDWYRIDMSGSGILNLNLEAQTDLGFILYNDKNQELVSRQELKGTSSKKSTYNFNEFLEKGIYYVRLLKNDSTGLYTITPSIELIKHTEAADNNAKEWAQALTPKEKYYGTVSLTDEQDWYKLDVTQASKITWTVNAHVKTNIIAYESANTILPKELVNGTEKKAETYKKAIYVEPGTYYLNISKVDSNVGHYTVQVDSSTVSSDEISANNTPLSAQSIKTTGKVLNGLVTVQDEEDWYTFTLGKKTTVRIEMSGNVYAAMKLLTEDKGLIFNVLYINDPLKKNKRNTFVGTLNAGKYNLQTFKMYENTGPYSLKITTGSKPSLTSVTTPKANAVRVTGKATKGSTVSVKVGKKTYSAKATSKGVFTVKVPKLKKGAKLAVTAKNSFGTSAKKTVTVKK